MHWQLVEPGIVARAIARQWIVEERRHEHDPLLPARGILLASSGGSMLWAALAGLLWVLW